jgi:EthD domain
VILVHNDPDTRLAAEEAFGLPASGWDGLAVLTFDSIEGAKAIFSDPDFVNYVTEDEGRFCTYPDGNKAHGSGWKFTYCLSALKLEFPRWNLVALC